ncbi:Hsp20/alpha crystallin family protein [Methanohalobium evestigatum]|nr:Hsp20/alpha crystallin family protein [Methanohalobium evestigatum]
MNEVIIGDITQGVETMARGIIRWDPVEDITRALDKFAPGGEMLAGRTLAPLVDIKDDDNNIIINADLPGVNKEDIDITVSDNTVQINAKCSKESTEEVYYRQERTYEGFSRTIVLPEAVTEEGASAKLENGVLKVTLPKLEKEHKITVQ